MKNFKLFSIVLLVIFSISCKSDDGIYGDDGLTYGNLIEEGSYRLVSAISDKEIDIKGNGNKSRNYYYQLDDCEKDDYYNFLDIDYKERKNGFGMVDYGVKCEGSGSSYNIIDEGTFEIIGENQLILTSENGSDKNFFNVTLKIIKIEDKKIKKLKFDYNLGKKYDNAIVTFIYESKRY